MELVSGKLQLVSKLQEFGQKLHYYLFRAYRGYGKPVTLEFIERQYTEGTWNFLNTIDEHANYMIVVGYIRYFSGLLNRSPKILDLGCGTGNIADLLGGYAYEKYLGLDVSDEAVREARSRNIMKTEFRKARFEDTVPDEKFDFIISTGAIHYAENPSQVLEEYRKCLNENGKFIVSLWRTRVNSRIWRKIEQHFEVVDATVVTNHKGVRWDIKVLQ